MRILLAVDGSPSSIEARDLAAGLAWPPGTVINLLTAYESPSDFAGYLGGAKGWTEGAEDTLRRDLDRELARLAEGFADRGWSVERRLVRGRPASSIVDSAADLRADVIVLGSRGRSPLASTVLGSVSAEVVERAPCSTIVARTRRATRLLVATDGSDESRAIPVRLGSWRVFRGLPAEVISVAPPRAPRYELLVGLYTLGSYPLAAERESLLEQHERFAGEVAHDLVEAGLPATSQVGTGDAADEIIAAAERSGADLIVVGSRGLRGIERLLLGSVARKILSHARCSVLVVRQGGDDVARGAETLD